MWKLARRFAGALVLTLALPPGAAAGDGTVEAMLEAALEADEGAGIQVAVMRHGDLVLSEARGQADLELGVALATDTKMRIGSISKVFTAMLAARMIQDGLLAPDDDVLELVTEFADKSVPITPRQIASHTSGIRHYDFADFAEANNTRFYPQLADALAVFAGDPLLSPPGMAHHYSSLAVNLLGVALERCAKASYPEALAARVTGPLHLEHTLTDHPLAIIADRTRFYTVLNGELVNTLWRDSSDYYPSGGLLSTAGDLVRFAHAVFETDFLDSERQALIRKEAILEDGTPVGYSFGWQIGRDAAGRQYYGHGGETNGAYAQVLYFPDAALAVAGIANYNVHPEEREAEFFDLVRVKLPAMHLHD